MWFWWFMFIFDLMLPLLMVFAGWMMWKHAPKSINGFLGYRTARSMKNLDTWKFAHAYCGRLWWKMGWVMLVPSFIIHIPFYHSSQDTIGIIGSILTSIQCVALVISILPVERALKKNFTDDGTPREQERPG